MKNVTNTAVLVVVTNNKKEADDGVSPFSVLTLINESGSFELLQCAITGGRELTNQIIDFFVSIVEFDQAISITPYLLRPVGLYSIIQESNLEIINSFVLFLDGKPSIRRKEGAMTPVWMSLDAFDHQPLGNNHNQIIRDVQDRLLEAAMAPSTIIPFSEETKRAIIKKYFPNTKEHEEERLAWIKRIQGSEVNVHVHQYLHPGVAIDVVIFGYKKEGKGRHDSLSVLLTHRKKDEALAEHEIDPWENTWSLPGTFLREKKELIPKDIKEKYPHLGNEYPGLETIREAAVRVVEEKTGIIISPEEVFYDMKPLVHYSRMGWHLRDGSPVITLPVFIPIKYAEVNNERLSSRTTTGCKWFPIKRELWNVDKEIDGGPKMTALRGVEKVLTGKDNKNNEDLLDDIRAIDTWRLEDINDLRSPEEIGLPATDVFIQDGQLIIKYYENVIRPHRPLQDMYYDENPSMPQGAELMTADHANIIVSALKEIAGNPRRTLHIVSRLLSGGTFAPAEIKRMLETWFFPWSFSGSNMRKKLVETSKLIVSVPDSGLGKTKERSWSYRFVDPDEIDLKLIKDKPF